MAKHKIQHNLTPEMAKKVTDKAIETYSAKFSEYAPTSKWVSATKNEVSFTAKGIKLKGNLELKPNEVELDLEVPFLLRVFQGRAIAIIDQEMREWIDRANRGELDA